MIERIKLMEEEEDEVGDGGSSSFPVLGKGKHGNNHSGSKLCKGKWQKYNQVGKMLPRMC